MFPREWRDNVKTGETQARRGASLRLRQIMDSDEFWENRLKELLTPTHFRIQRQNSYRQDHVVEMVILLGAVDNDKSRQLCHRVMDSENRR